jgi:hypothetical protein
LATASATGSGGTRLVVSLGALAGVNVRRGGDTGRIDRLHLLGVGEDVGELAL